MTAGKTPQISRKRKSIRFFLKTVIYVTVLIFFFLTAAGVLFHIPSIQKYIVDQVTENLSRRLNRDVHVDYFRLSIMGSLEIKNFYISNDPEYGLENMASIEHLYCEFNPLAFFEERAHIRELTIIKPILRLGFNKDRDSNIFCGHPRNRNKKKRARDDDSIIRRVFEKVQCDHIVLSQILFEFDYLPSGLTVDVPSLSLESWYQAETNEMHAILEGYSVRTAIKDRMDTVANLAIECDLWGDGVHQSMLTINSAGNDIWINGICKLTNFKNPRLEFTSNLRLDLNQVEKSFQLTVPMSGEVLGKAYGNGLARALNIQSYLYVQDADIHRFEIDKVYATADYTDKKFKIQNIYGTVYDGDLNGSGEIFVSREHKGMKFDARVENLDIKSLMTQQKIPLEVPGICDIDFAITSNSFKPDEILVSGTAAGMETLPQSLPGAQSLTPLNIAGDFHVKNKTFYVPRAQILNPGIYLNLFNGEFTSESIAGKINARFSDVSKILNRLEMYSSEPKQFPDYKGKGIANGTLSGSPTQYEVSFTSLFPDLEILDNMTHKSRIAGIVTPELINLSQISLHGDIANLTGELMMSRNPEIKIESGEFEIGRLFLPAIHRLSSVKTEFSGHASGKLVLNAHETVKPIPSHLTIKKLGIAKIPLGNANLRFNYLQNGVFDLTLNAVDGISKLVLEGQFPKDGNTWWTAVGENFDLASLNGVQPIPLGGIASFRADFPVNAQMQEAEIRLESPAVLIRGVNSGPADIEGLLRLGNPTFLAWDAWIAGAEILSTGQVIVTDDYPVRFTADLYGARVKTLTAASPLFPWTDILDGEVTGHVDVNWDVRDPESLDVKCIVNDMSLAVNNYNLTLQKPTVVGIQGYRLTMGETDFRGPDIEALLQGNIDFNGNLNLVLNGNCRIERLDNLTTFITRPSGNVTFDLLLNGNVADPDFQGSMNIEEMYFQIPYFNTKFEDFHSEITFDHKFGTIQYFEGLAGGTYLSLNGDMGLKNYLPNLLDLTMSAEKIEFEFPEGYRSEGTIDISILGNLSSPAFMGEIHLNRVMNTSRIDYKTMIINESRAKLSLKDKNVQTKRVFKPIFNPKFQLKILAEDNVIMDNNFAKLEMKLDLDFQGSLAKPQLFGRIEALEGLILFQDRKFEVERLTLDFIDPENIDPYIDLLASSDIQEYDVSIELTGPLYSDLDVTPFSNPSLSNTDLWALILLGKTTDQMNADSGDYVASTLAYVTGSIQDEIEKRFANWMGFDEFSIDPILSSSDESPSAKFTVKKRFGPNLSVTYSRAAATADDLLIIEYRIADNLYIIGQKNENNSIGGDIRYRWEFD